MRDQSLLFFDTPKEFKEFIRSMGIYRGWRIQSGLLNDRGRIIENREYVRNLRSIFEEKGFFRKKVSLAEVVSWLDNFTFINRLFDSLRGELPREVYNEISISIEYMIEMSKKMRVDYSLIYKDRILLLEMRTASDFNKLKSTWDKKFRELIIYKELMSYYLKSELVLYALITMYEYDDGKRIYKNIEYNQNQIKYLAEYIKRYLIR